MVKINLPYKFTPRSYQLPLWNLQSRPGGINRALLVWHRRSGKDKTCLNVLINQIPQRKGQYYYYFPTQTQGRKILWDGIDRDGFRYMEHFPKSMVKHKNNQEMKIETVCGSIFQIVGTDRLEVVGPNPVGAVFSEMSLQNPRGWSYVRPILAENKGWAIFNGTPRGRNHYFDLFTKASDNSDWFCELLTVDDTGAVSQEAIEAERQGGMSETLIQQEFYCSWDVGELGAYFARNLGRLRVRKPPQIGRVPFDKNYCVHTAWDVGKTTCVWCFQVVGRNRYYIRYYEGINEGIDYYADLLLKWTKDYGYYYGQHFGPWDVDNPAHKATEGKTVRDVARQHGLNFRVFPMDKDVMNSIDKANNNIHLCWFDVEGCEFGIQALENFHEVKNIRMSKQDHPKFIGKPDKDWSEHGAKAFIISDQAMPFIESGPGADITRRQIKEWEMRYGVGPVRNYEYV